MPFLLLALGVVFRRSVLFLLVHDDAVDIGHLVDKDTAVGRANLDVLVRNAFNHVAFDDTSVFQVNDVAGCLGMQSGCQAQQQCG